MGGTAPGRRANGRQEMGGRAMRRVGPEGKTTLRDKVLPERHANWWNFNEAEKKDQTMEELYEGLFTTASSTSSRWHLPPSR
jgi:hypothetical protein